MMTHTDTKFVANLKDKKGNVYHEVAIYNPNWLNQKKQLWANFHPVSSDCALYAPSETATDGEMFNLGFYRVESISRAEYYVEYFEVYHAE